MVNFVCNNLGVKSPKNIFFLTLHLFSFTNACFTNPVQSNPVHVLQYPEFKCQIHLFTNPCFTIHLLQIHVLQIQSSLAKSGGPNGIPKSSTTLALLEMFHVCLQGTDGNGSTVRTLLFDYKKAFDLIDHSILVRNLRALTIPPSVTNKLLDHRFPFRPLAENQTL